jgi:hypothetical protein
VPKLLGTTAGNQNLPNGATIDMEQSIDSKKTHFFDMTRLEITDVDRAK